MKAKQCRKTKGDREMKTQMKAMWAILAMTTIWLTINSTKINTCIDDKDEIDKIVNNMVASLEEQQQQADEPTFKDVFKEKRELLGAGAVFKWEGDYYTTDYAEEIKVHYDDIIGGWVLNGDDFDDYCRTNDRDECGICGGDGARYWYADRDGDGLGDHQTATLSCESPDEEITFNRIAKK